jgi:hypothetical protein
MMIKTTTAVIVLLALLSGCAVIPTFGSISKTPIQLANGDLAYRYEGRANFPHQQVVADQMMSEHCVAVNGGTAVIVDAQQSVIGAAVFGNSNTNIAGTASGPYPQRTYTANARTTSSGSTLANKQQQIIFRCLKL